MAGEKNAKMATSAQTKVVKLFEIHHMFTLLFTYILDHVLSNLIRYALEMKMYCIIVA